jgi:hypothetical protein
MQIMLIAKSLREAAAYYEKQQEKYADLGQSDYNGMVAARQELSDLFWKLFEQGNENTSYNITKG